MSTHGDVVVAAALAISHLPDRHRPDWHVTTVPATMPDRPTGAAHLVDLADQVRAGRDVLPELLSVLADNALAVTVATLATRDRTWLLVARAEVDVAVRALPGVDVHGMTDEAGAPLHDQTMVHSWRLSRLTPGPVTDQVRQVLG